MKTKPKPLDQLSPEACELHRRLKKEWTIEDGAGQLALLTLCQCLDRMRAAQAVIQRDGSVVQDRWGQKKLHPATVLEREARAGMLACLKALNLDFPEAN